MDSSVRDERRRASSASLGSSRRKERATPTEDGDGREIRESTEDRAPSPAKVANSATIQIYARVRPPRKTAGANSLPRAAPSRSPHPPEPEPFSSRYTIFPPSNPGSDDPKDPSRFPHLHFDVPKDADAGIVNNTKDSFDFRFDAVFDRDASQEEVFDVVAKPVVQSVLEGYNGTVFAYGQTGSGKTFTITGGATRYADRGIIPRSLQHVFAEVARHPESEFDVHIAYLEIYNEQGYDLLGENIADAAVESLARETRRLEDLPKVSLHPDPSDPSSFQLRNLAWHAAPTLPSALNLLFLGDTNRMIAETPMNPSSSRSHCVFMVQVVRRQTGGGTGTVRRGKLCLVDLAGSERISRTSLAGSTLLREARSINLSLHHLEQCIVALHEKSLGRRDHVPYRNSVLTCMLKDSLGGNCRTVMVATVVGEVDGVEESISTCRFAQRVASISNIYSLNEEVDPSILIARLRREIASLRSELALARQMANGGIEAGTDEDLPEYEKQNVRKDVEAYVGLTDGGHEGYFVDGAKLCWGDTRKVLFGFEVMKDLIRSRGNHAVSTTVSPEFKSELSSVQAQVEKLRSLVGHRDREIAVLVGTINKYRERLEGLEGESSRPPFTSQPSITAYPSPSQSQHLLNVPNPSTSIPPPSTVSASVESFDFSGDLGGWNMEDSDYGFSSNAARARQARPRLPEIPTNANLPPDKAKAFEQFRRIYPENAWIEDHKNALKTKYTEAKRLGAEAGEMREEISELHILLRTELYFDDESDHLPDVERQKAWLENAESGKMGVVKESEKNAARNKLMASVGRYKSSYSNLKSLKLEIDHVHHLLDTARIKLTKDFERWFVTEYLVGKASPIATSMSHNELKTPTMERGSFSRSAVIPGDDSRRPTSCSASYSRHALPPAGSPVSYSIANGLSQSPLVSPYSSAMRLRDVESRHNSNFN